MKHTVYLCLPHDCVEKNGALNECLLKLENTVVYCELYSEQFT